MKIDRMISIIMILLERKKVSVPELAQIGEVTTRTIQRDLSAINQAGVPIISYPGKSGGVGIMENYKLEKRLFSTADVATLLMSLGSIRSSLSGGEVAGALAKIKGMIPEEHREAIEQKAEQLAIDTTPWFGNRSCGDLIALLQNAMGERRLVRFAYSDRTQKKSVRTVEPYRLILKSMSWYFEGFCLERQDFRVFKLSRMSDVVVRNERYEPRAFSPGQIVQPDFEDKDMVSATLRIGESAREQLMDLCGPDCMEREGDGTWIAKIPVFDNEIGYRFLLGFGPDCECLAPPGLRDNFRRCLGRIAALYAE